MLTVSVLRRYLMSQAYFLVTIFSFVLTGCVSEQVARYHMENTREADRLFKRMRDQAKERAQDLLREQLRHAATDAEREAALETHFLSNDTREMLSDDFAIWLMSQTVEAAGIPAGMGLFGNFGKQIGRELQRIGAQQKKGAGAK